MRAVRGIRERVRASAARSAQLAYATLPLACAVLALALATAAAARADVFAPAALASAGLREGAPIVEQADRAEHPAISEDGRYVAFDGSFGGISGVWRKDLQTGAIEQVAGGDAELPSISGDGRFISFTSNEGATLAAITNDRPDEQPQREAVNVYVRDMGAPGEPKPPTGAGAFVIASAVDGSDEALQYETSAPQQFGSFAAARSAISEDGRYVAFTTTAQSDLVWTSADRQAHEKGEAPPTETPPLQVALRDLWTRETKLVSVEYEGRATERPVSVTSAGSTTYGAVYRPVAFPGFGAAAASQGAAVSADGTTVAWMGQEISKQAPALAGRGEDSPEYVEPLWRYVAGGANEPTRRVTGGSDPLAPACAASGETTLTLPPTLADPCQGPFEASLRGAAEGGPGVYPAPSEIDSLPRLSANGLTVAFFASQVPVGGGEEFQNAGQSDDLYAVDMATGLTRVESLRRLTELASDNPNVGGGFAALTDLGVSPDGTEIAFSTLRTSFPLSSPALVSEQPAEPEMQELYDVDLANDTLSRVTHGFRSEEQQSEPPSAVGATEAGSPSFSADGNTIAFSSDASNLVYGESAGASNVFVVSRRQFETTPVPQYVSPAPANPAVEPAWVLSASARSRRDGSVLLEVQAPGAGSLSAVAQAHVLSRGATARATKSRKPSRVSPARAARRHARRVLVVRKVASAARAARSEGPLVTVLRLARAYAPLASAAGGLSAQVVVTFSSPGHPALRKRLAVAFARIARGTRRRRHGARR